MIQIKKTDHPLESIYINSMNERRGGTGVIYNRSELIEKLPLDENTLK